MTNIEKYNQLFIKILRVLPEELDNLRYRRHRAWDSIGHMDLMNAMEETFGVSMGTLDVLDFSSYEKGKEILAKYDVIIE
ncbi:acyl carrier protein [Eubacterium barkeri]|uniref:Acyl carrier protein n=1 Tax=Eubacterium barkeri TaxID=1528 RepID=A0A1H3K1J8_EUBBA|nr:acyl carrier protein [Eubacterium barkeri]SDY45729.1 hypothetical protein SAMN04488579_1377 [Eubacterium barkeri]